MLETRFERHHGRRLRVATLGDGPPLVLLHGYPENLQIFEKLAPELAKTRKVIAVDWPGMGQSEAWKGGASPVHMAQRLIDLLDAWGIDAADLFATDMGGQAAIVAGARHPERVRRLIVSNSLVFWDAPTSWEIRVLRRFGWNRMILARLPRAVFRRAERSFLSRGTKLPQDLRGDLWSAFRRPEVRDFIIKMCAAYQGFLPRLPHLMGEMKVRTLVLWAERDQHFPLVHATRMASTVPGATLEVIAGGEHWMVWERAEEVARKIETFLSAGTGERQSGS